MITLVITADQYWELVSCGEGCISANPMGNVA